MKRKAFALVLAALALAAAFAVHEFRRLAVAPIPLASAQVVVVERGLTVRGVGRALAAAGVIGDPADLVWAARLWSRAPLKAGEYAFEPGITVRDVLRRLERGDVVLHAFTVVEGVTVRELRRALDQVATLEHTLAEVPDERLLEALGLPPGPAEGRFLPDTYRFPRGMSDREFLRRAHRAMASALAEAWAARAPGLPLDDASALLTLASVVEKETAVAGERAQIAGVFVRRLRLGMRLQTDPTVIYGMGARFDGNLRRSDLMTDTPYNTYTRAGLPPTPICLPGRDALRAAANPAPGDALYFVATGDGGHAFSATYEAHQAAVRRYLQRLREQRNAQ